MENKNSKKFTTSEEANKKTHTNGLKLPISNAEDEDIVFISSSLPKSANNLKSASNGNGNKKVFEYYSQEVELSSDDSDDDYTLVELFKKNPIYSNSKNVNNHTVGPNSHKANNNQKTFQYYDDNDSEESDNDEDIQLIYDNKLLLDQIDGKLKSINCGSSAVADDYGKIETQTSPIVVVNNEKSSSTDTSEISIISINDSSNDDDLLYNAAVSFESTQKPKPASNSKIRGESENLVDSDKILEKKKLDTFIQKTRQTSVDSPLNSTTSTKRLMTTEPASSDPFKIKKRKLQLLTKSPERSPPPTKTLTSLKPSSPAARQSDVTQNQIPSGQTVQQVQYSIKNQKPTTSRAIEDADDNELVIDDDDLNYVDARKKQILTTMDTHNNLETYLNRKKQRPSLVTNNRPKMTREQILNLNPRDKAKLNFIKSKTNSKKCTESLSITQSVNVAKMENKARMIEHYAKNRMNLNLANSNNSAKDNRENCGVLLSASDVNEDARIQSFKRVNKEKRNFSTSDIIDKNAHTESTEKVVLSNNNDVVGNILSNMNKQKLVQKPIKEPCPIETSMYTIENFYFRILKCMYNWLNEQETHSNEKNCKQPPVVDENELMVLIDSYLNYGDYYNAMFPLLLSETWEDIYRNWKEKKAFPSPIEDWVQQPMWYKSCVPVDHSGLVLLTCQMIIPRNSRNYPNEDDLMRVELNTLINNQSEWLNYFAIVKNAFKLKRDENTLMKCVSDYIKEKEKEQPIADKPYSDESKNVQSSVRDQYLVYEVVFYIRKRGYVIKHEDRLNYENMCSMSSSFRRARALVSFQHSHMMNSILKASYLDPIFAVKTLSDDSELKKYFNLNDFNESQQSVIINASSIINYTEPKLYFIQGPPGTGKSFTIIGIIDAMFSRFRHRKPSANENSKPNEPIVNNKKFKLLICSPSNGGCDELTRRLKKLKTKKNSSLQAIEQAKGSFRIVRIGRSDNIHRDCEEFMFESLLKSKIDELTCKKQSEKSKSLAEHYKSLKNTEVILTKKIQAVKASSNPNQNDLKEMESQLVELKKKIKKFETQSQINSNTNKNIGPQDRKNIERQARETILKDADIIICTLNYSGNQILDCLMSEKNNGQPLINAIIIDEASQCLELESLIPMRFGCNKIIQVGDPEQLPATVLSKLAENKSFGMSMFERIYQRFRFNEFSKNLIKMLYVQYRMHPEICIFPSNKFYGGKLITQKNIKDERDSQSKLLPYMVFDVKNSQEVGDETNGAIYNPIEADEIVCFCKKLILNLNQLNVGIVTPYQKQSQHLKEKIRTNFQNHTNTIEVGTVDSFQGREKDIIIISCVRAKSQTKTIGFLSSKQRLNVALTRAKVALYIFCHVESLKVNEDWRHCVEDAQKRKLVYEIN